MIVVFDNTPLDTADWMRRAAERASLSFVENAAIGLEMAHSAEARQALLEQTAPSGPDDPVAKHYRAVLRSALAGRDRVALDGWGWLLYAENVSAAVLDFSGIDAHARKLRVPAERQIEHAERLKETIRGHARRVLPPGAVLELPAGATDAQKEEAAVAFVAGLAPS